MLSDLDTPGAADEGQRKATQPSPVVSPSGPSSTSDEVSAFKQWIVAMFNTIDTDGTFILWQNIYPKSQIFAGDGFIGLEEYRYDCVNRQAVTNIKDLDKAFKIISENGGITRYIKIKYF